MNGNIIIIGGGAAGMETAGQLARSGYMVTLLEKQERSGGHINNWYHLFPDHRNSDEVISYLNRQIENPNINFLKGVTIDNINKAGGKFHIKVSSGPELSADALVIATGFDLFRSERKEEYGYGIYDNVYTSADLEEMFRKGKITSADGRVPLKVGIVHCVGSRDEKAGNVYCSKLCCVTAVKQAIEIRKQISGSKVFCFYMDMRMGGAYYEELYREAQEVWRVNFIRGKVSEAGETMEKRVVIKVEDTLAGRPLKMELDMLILMAGMEMPEEGRRIASMAGLKTGENRFFNPVDHHYGSNRSNIEGIFYAGTCTAPMNITETISHARAAASEVIDYLNGNRNGDE